jgi:hypothetical protein
MRRFLLLAVALLAVVAVVSCTGLPAGDGGKTTSGKDGEAQEYLFCFWNVENLFDDKDDKRNSTDEPYDNAYADNAKILKLKLDRLATTIIAMNGGVGPDIFAGAEVESIRAAELLKDALNAKLKDAKKDDKYQYDQVLMVNLDAGRHIAPCVITRVPVDVRGTKLNKAAKLRILETHLLVNGHDLTLMASHWTSQLKQRDGSDGDSGREKYAKILFDRFYELAKMDVDVDYLICGDFNDSPDADPIVKDLGAIADRTKVKPTNDPKNLPYLLNLMAGKDPAKFGTIWYNGKPLIYDQICVSPGLLDKQGWSVDTDSVATITKDLTRPGSTRREPWRFSDPDRDLKDSDRGYSDHFPVTVKLKVAAKK